MRRALLIAGLLALPGCFEGGVDRDCRIDTHCGSGEACTRTGECAGGTLIEARISWTVAGQTVSAVAPEPCEQAGINAIGVSFAEDGLGDTTYQPINCAQGSIVFDRMPPRFGRVAVLAFDDRGDVIAEASRPLEPGVNEIAVDLDP